MMMHNTITDYYRPQILRYS